MRPRNITMASSRCIWIALFLALLMTGDSGVLGRAVDTLGFTADESPASTLRTNAPRRWRRGVVETHRERCAELAAPWQENMQQAPRENATTLQLRFRPFSQTASHDLVFPGKSLFSFIRRVYRCCQQGRNCRSVKGIQGRLRGGKTRKLRLKLNRGHHQLVFLHSRAEIRGL